MIGHGVADMDIDISETFAAIVRGVATNSLTGLALSAVALLSSDVFFTLPALNGFWDFEIHYEQTNHGPFDGLDLRYTAVIIQQGTNFHGTGEKDAERLPNSDRWMEYSGGGRIPIEITGYIQRRFLGRDSIVLHIQERGTRRQSSAFQRLTLSGGDALVGTFDTTVADTSGPVRWERR
ncbi:MAG: hypothetical protein AAGF58_15245 [Pseudomonadota bacterium]